MMVSTAVTTTTSQARSNLARLAACRAPSTATKIATPRAAPS